MQVLSRPFTLDDGASVRFRIPEIDVGDLVTMTNVNLSTSSPSSSLLMPRRFP
ncbi:hypothetical protein M408DRAFT_130843 [Serendipita vermifera MAFF 305830]|uniref:Uncharacterized protein n=1 Tax=Serendipita vermifera MAFF 305830 TaxID=933852 RepID=A0A0C3AKH9_SERVB|nr:hypothetical protein M408DRAFT_130843 [Serendipita vermifera MAFF 305830]